MSAEIVQVVLLPELREQFQKWLKDRGLKMYLMPSAKDDLPTYGVGPLK